CRKARRRGEPGPSCGFRALWCRVRLGCCRSRPAWNRAAARLRPDGAEPGPSRSEILIRTAAPGNTPDSRAERVVFGREGILGEARQSMLRLARSILARSMTGRPLARAFLVLGLALVVIGAFGAVGWAQQPHPSPLVLPVDTTIRVQIAGVPDGVIHSWFVPSFGVQEYAMPGRLNESWMRIEREGSYYGECNQICGINHAFMPIEVKAVSKADFQT